MRALPTVGFLVVVFAVLLPDGSRGVTPQNQCPGDCSPCVSDIDPFCNHHDPWPDGPGQPGLCQICRPNPAYNNRPTCDEIRESESGRPDCHTEWEGATPISCSESGGFYCSWIIVVTP